jgi:threonyl-tRNA synthetase
LGARVRDAQNEKVPYMLIVGQKEVDTNSVTLRKRNSREMAEFQVAEFIKFATEKIKNKDLEI